MFEIMKNHVRVIRATLAIAIVAIAAVAGAWYTGQSASAGCDGGSATISVNFENQEPAGSNLGMRVIARDGQTGSSIDLGDVAPQASASGTINTGRSSLAAGTVTFHLTWSDGHGGSDSRSANYGAVTCDAPPTETPEPPTETPELPTETPAPPEETPVPSETPETPTNTPVPPVRHTPEPTQVPWQMEWRACDAKISDVLPSQMAEWMERCQPTEAEIVVAQVVETPAPVCTDCGNEARFELLDNAVVFGGLTDSDNRGTFYTRGQALPTSEAISLVFENQGLKVYRWVDETPDAEGEEYPCSAEPQIEQFDLVDGVILYRVLPQNSRWDLQTVFENIDGASLDEGQMIAAWYEFSRTSDANFGFRPVGTYTPDMEDQVWAHLGRVFGIRIEAQVAHDTEPVFDYTALQIAAAAIHEHTLKGIEAVVASVSQQGATRGQSLVVSAKLDAGSVTVAQISAPAAAESVSIAFVLPLALVVGVGGFAINRRRQNGSS